MPELIAYNQLVGISMCTYCVTLVADLYLFCYERDIMFSISEKQNKLMLFKHLILLFDM